ncbi:cell division protein FtsQ/DivIB [Chelatococcus albus]|uniref:cell division protein FtsQ/DivIB n=1 Tax=Chelatococcus albus TaxID=3047466 RepID=UPI003BEEBCB6
MFGGMLAGEPRLALATVAAGGRTASASAAMVGLPQTRRTKSFASRASVRLPIERRLPRGLGSLLTLAFFAVVGLYGAALGGHIDSFRATYGEPHHALARLVGLGIDHVTISGIAELTESEVLAAAGISPKISLAFLDAAEVRRRLESVPMIREASVRKLYPSELSITLVEREPYALWQRNGELFVIAADGTVIDLLNDARFANLPLVVGDHANDRSREYLALLEAAGPLRNRIRAGALVSGRRWNLKLDNGVDVRLPETGAAAAVARLASLERDHRILDKDILTIDLRMPDRVAVRLSEEAAAARADMLKKKPKMPRGGSDI